MKKKIKEDIFIDKNVILKYEVIRKFLKKHFLHDTELRNYINSLPNVWILKSWWIEILFSFVFFTFIFANIHFLKIHTGILISLKGSGESDLIYIIAFSVFFGIYMYLFYRRGKILNDLEYILLRISCIIKKGV